MPEHEWIERAAQRIDDFVGGLFAMDPGDVKPELRNIIADEHAKAGCGESDHGVSDCPHCKEHAEDFVAKTLFHRPSQNECVRCGYTEKTNA